MVGQGILMDMITCRVKDIQFMSHLLEGGFFIFPLRLILVVILLKQTIS